MALSTTLFPTQGEIPPEFRFAPVQGRILIDGKIIDSGFDTKEVRSPCLIRDDTDTLQAPVLGTTAQVSVDVLIEALDAASGAWAKGDGAGPPATCLLERKRCPPFETKW